MFKPSRDRQEELGIESKSWYWPEPYPPAQLKPDYCGTAAGHMQGCEVKESVLIASGRRLVFSSVYLYSALLEHGEPQAL